MNEIFKEEHRTTFPSPRFARPLDAGREGAIESTVRAVYDDHYGVLCIDLDATHIGGCEDDGTPSGCRFCAPFFPREKRMLIDLSAVPRHGTAAAIRVVIREAESWYAEVGELARQAAERGAMEVAGG
jgi:hypothetical protein